MPKRVFIRFLSAFGFFLLVPLYTLLAQKTPTMWVELESNGVFEAGAYGEEITKRGLSPNLLFSFGLDAKYFGVSGSIKADTNDKYGPELADIPGGDFLGLSAIMEEGGVYSSFGNLRLRAGRFRHYDIVDSPYSLFVNSTGIPANIIEIEWDDGFFSYGSRWIELNNDSTQDTDAWGLATYAGTQSGIDKLGEGLSGFPDRGANIKKYVFKLGNMRFGIQDAAVYTGKSFDPEYLLNPLPQYFIQYIKATGGRPWATGRDENNLLGFFWTLERPGEYSLLAQVLIDDFNLHFILPDSTWNPWQAAFNLGGRLHTRSGAFGLFVAGATKYTFEPSEMYDSASKVWSEQVACSYGYSYYPETRFDKDWKTAGFQPGVIAIEDNLIGYKYGQNNVAVQTDWQGKLAGFDAAAEAEFRLAGANSPANPWHDLTNDPQDGTHWLDDSVLETRIMLGASMARSFGDWSFSLALRGGVAFNAMELRKPTVATSTSVAPADSDIWIFEPVAGNTKYLLSLSIGARYRWNLR